MIVEVKKRVPTDLWRDAPDRSALLMATEIVTALQNAGALSITRDSYDDADTVEVTVEIAVTNLEAAKILQSLIP